MVGSTLNGNFSIIRLIRSDRHAHIFLVVDVQDSPVQFYTAKAYPQKGLSRKLWKAQKRHRERLASKIRATIELHDTTFLVMDPALCVLDHTQRCTDNNRHGCQFMEAAIPEDMMPRTMLSVGPDVIYHYGNARCKSLFRSLEIVVATTHNAVQCEGFRLGSSITASEQIENELRRSRTMLQTDIEAMDGRGLLTADACHRLRAWHLVDTSYRSILRSSGAIQPCGQQVQRLGLPLLQKIEARRVHEWKGFTNSLASILTRLNPDSSAGTAIGEEQIASGILLSNAISEDNLGKESSCSQETRRNTVKQRNKRRRRRGRVLETSYRLLATQDIEEIHTATD